MPDDAIAHRALHVVEQQPAAPERDVMLRIMAAHGAHARAIDPLFADTPSAPMADDERLQQQRSAIAEIVKKMGLSGHDKTVVEFGSGDGALSRTLYGAGVAGTFVLVDRSKQRLNRASTNDGIVMLCADVATLRPEALREAVSGECVVVSNHLCGAALDAALRCALDAWKYPAAHEDAQGGLAGIVAVTCCHHACADASFLGTAFLRDVCGLSAPDRAFARKWSLMAPRRERAAHVRPRVLEAATLLGIAPAEAAHLGACCRALMDSARASYLESCGFTVALVHHVPQTLTADNVMLLATRPPPPAQPHPQGSGT